MSSAHTSLLEARGMSVAYQGHAVLTDVSLEVKRGEILAFVGPTGAGKSTLLRLLGLLESPSAGELRYRGQLTRGLNTPLTERRRIGMVFQRPILLLAQSVRENLVYGFRVRKESPPKDALNQLWEELGLLPLLDRRAGTLSGGERQRVAIARAMAIRPELLLLDEPTAHLDPAYVAVVERLLRRLNDEASTSIIVVTHHLFQARRLAQRTGLLLNGHLEALALTSEFFNDHPHNAVRAFVAGDMVY